MEFIKTKDSRISMVVAVLFNVAILLLMWIFLRFEMPDPPATELYASVAMADYGFDEQGSGNVEAPAPKPQPKAEPKPPTEETNSDFETNQNNDDASVETGEETAVKDPTPAKDPDPTPEPVKEPEPTISDNLADAFNNIKPTENTQPGGEGGSNKPGNEGNKDGSIDGKGVVGGQGVLGGGLSGRGWAKGPSGVTPNERGKVVLTLFVNKQGQISKIVNNYKASNTTSASLFLLARKAIKNAKFSPDPNGASLQVGTITFNFELQ